MIDDDPELGGLLADYLINEGFEVELASTGPAGLSLAQAGHYSAIVLDIMLPGMNGLDVLRTLRKTCSTPVLMLTAKGDDLDRILGLELGADDYLPKPCNPRELLARLRAILRRSQLAASANTADDGAPRPHTQTIVCGPVSLNTGERSAKVASEPVELTRAEFAILQQLMSQAGSVVDKSQLYEQALGRPFEAYDRSLDMHISNVRKKLSQAGVETFIQNCRGVGYQVESD